MRKLLVCAALALCSACGSSTTVVICTGNVMGKLMGTFSVCNDFDQRYRANLDSYQFTGAYTELPTSFTVSTEWNLKGEPEVKSYSADAMRTVTEPMYKPTPALNGCNITLRKGAFTWIARYGAGLASSGNCTLVLSEVSTADELGNVTTYKIRGNISAQLEADPGSGATETVNVSMDFCQGDGTMCMPPPMM